MGASIYLRFPGGESANHPGLPDDDTRYARWIEKVLSDKALSEQLRVDGYGALLFTFPAFLPDKKMQWVSPEKLRDAARSLRHELLAQSPVAMKWAAMYFDALDDEPAHVILADEMGGIAKIAEYARVSRILCKRRLS